jgi:hypothetical protein
VAPFFSSHFCFPGKLTTASVLADVLLSHTQGHRPVNLIGTSLGARTIYFCLLELARHAKQQTSNKNCAGNDQAVQEDSSRPTDPFSIVQNVIILGAPVAASQSDWKQARSVVNGTFVNGYAGRDWILGFLFRASVVGWSNIAGLQKLTVEGVENVDLSDVIDGHLSYREPLLVERCLDLAYAASEDLNVKS